MIKAKHHKVIYPLFKQLTTLFVKRHFNAIHIEGSFEDNGEAVLILANHMSWWDGFWITHLNHKRVKRKIHFMMLESQLRKHWYFQYTGGYSVKQRSKSILETLSYTKTLLSNSENAVFMFPQGKIHSLYQDQLSFEKGAERIVQNINSQTQVLFVANLLDYFSERKPSLFVYLKHFIAEDLIQNSLERSYNEFYHSILTTHKAKTC